MKCIHEYLEDCLAARAEQPYIFTKTEEGFKSASFGEFISSVRYLSAALSEEFPENGRVYIYGENCIEWMICDLAAMGYAGVSVPLDKEWTEFDLNNVLSCGGDGVFFFSESRRERLGEIMKKYGGIKFYSLENDLPKLLEKGRSLGTDKITPQKDMNRTAKIIFSSGTTAAPKAIPLSQGNMFSNWDTLFLRTPMTEKDRSYIFLPLNHVYSGVANFLYTIISGMKIYLCRDLREINEDVISIRPTVICTVPLMLERMYALMTDELLAALKEVRFLYNGGSFTKPELKDFFLKSGVNLLEAYGTTESSSVIALSKIENGKAEREMTVMENLTVKILDPDETGEGEILVKGGSVSAGYLNCPDNSVFFDSEGYFHTGDLGRLDDKRSLFVSGRKKRMLNAPDGKNIFADEIEKLILQSNAVKAAKVYIEEGEITASVFADFTAQDESSVREYMEKVNEKLPKYKKIRRLHISDDKLGGRFK